MQIKKKTLLTVSLLIVMIIFLSGFTLMKKNEKVKDLEVKLENKSERIENKEVEIKELNNKVEIIKDQKIKVEKKLQTIIEKLNIDNLDIKDLETIKSISNNTPLDLKTSIVLMNVSKKYELKPSLILSIMELESNFKKYEVGRDQDRGYMQIIPQTEKWLANKFEEVHNLKYDPERIFEPEYNIELAGAYLSLLKKAYGNDYNRILSEYNRGPYNLAEYYKEHKTYATKYSKVILEKEKKYLTFND